jgi:hypothetical protein
MSKQTAVKFSMYQWLLGNTRRYCNSCNQIQYHSCDQLRGYTCKCGANKIMDYFLEKYIIMSNQTAVDYIFSQLPNEYTTTRDGFDVYQQAKEMFEEQIVEAHFEGQYDKTEGYPIKIAEQYYNETFNK